MPPTNALNTKFRIINSIKWPNPEVVVRLNLSGANPMVVNPLTTAEAPPLMHAAPSP